MDQGTAWKNVTERKANLGWIEKLLAIWIGLSIVIGLALGKYLPDLSKNLEIGILSACFS